MRRVKTSVALAECKIRALIYLEQKGRMELVKASAVAGAIWPGVQFHSQGAGAAPSRILRSLIDQKAVEWDVDNGDWGWSNSKPIGF